MALRDFPRHRGEDAAEFVAGGYWNADTLASYLRGWAERAPDKVAIRAPDRALTYRETCAAARRLANALLDLGLRKGDTVAIQLPNLAEFLIAYFGVTMMGGILSTMHMPYRAGEMEPLLRHAQARAVIAAAPTASYDAPATMQGLRRTVPSLEHVIVGTGPAPVGALALGDLIARGAEHDIADPPVASDPCLLCFTSGTSAAPKGVLRTYETLTANARVFAPVIHLTAGDVVMVAPPFTHVFGLCCVNLALYAGATNVLIPLFSPDAYAATLRNGRPSVVFSAPAHVAATLKAGLLDRREDLQSVRDVIVAGSVCPPEVAAAFEQRLPRGRVGQLFGMTEVILVMQTPLDAPAAVRHHTTGRCTRGIDARIAAPDGRVLGSGTEGELQLRGYSVFAGYLANDEANRASFTADAWFRTGDLATMDGEGNVAITGRVKDLINRGGIKINPTDLENLIAAHDSVVQAAIVPMPDEILGERACLFVTLAPGKMLTFEQMTGYLAANNVAKMKWPERLEIIAEMPMTPTRKIVKGELVRRLRAAQARVSS